MLAKSDIPKIIDLSEAARDPSREPTRTPGMSVEFEADSKPYD
jgi:hypothetical protein